MRLKKRFFLLLLLFLIPLNLAVSLWVLTADLKLRYPHLNFSQSRLGIASWYSKTDKNINERTANNEKFDDKKLTCASWDYPFGQKLIVINTFNGKWVECRVNDRGPNKRLNREIDLTKAAFQKIAPLNWGLVYVTIIPIHSSKKI